MGFLELCEAVLRQVNYLIDEAGAVGKGANATISYVHHFFTHHGLRETDFHLHAYNCAGQNKKKNFYGIWHGGLPLNYTSLSSTLC